MAIIIKVVGIGPGDGRYITPLAQEMIKAAEVLVGGRRQLETLASPHQEQFIIGNNLPAVLDYIKEQSRAKSVVVLASGDPGLFSIGTYLVENLGEELLEFIPGISSVQLMFARLRRPWQDARIMSLHGRSIDDLNDQLLSKGTTALLTGGEWIPQKIAAYLIKAGLHDCQVAVGQNLSYPDEKIVRSTLQELAQMPEDFSNSVMVIFNE